MTHLRHSFASLGLLLASLLGSTAMAQQPPPSHNGRPPAPPPEAYKACEGQTEGATVTLTMPDGKSLTGTCRTINGSLVAMPAGGPPPSTDGKAPAR